MIACLEPVREASTRLLRKGALVSETYQILAGWDPRKSVRENLDMVGQSNSIGATNAAWLREITVTLSSRFRSNDMAEPLAVLAKAKMRISEWRWFLLWRIQTTDLFFRHFVLEWLFPHFEKGSNNMRSEQVAPFFRNMARDIGAKHKEISDYGVIRGGRDLLRMASEFGLVEGKASKNFAPAHVPESAFLWALHDLYSRTPNALKVIHDPSWRLFLLSPAAVEREILDLHQFQKLDYQTAGSLSQLKLPFADSMSYLRSILSQIP